MIVPPARPRREHTIYECPACDWRLLGVFSSAARAAAHSPARSVPVAHTRDEPVAITDLTQEVAMMPGSR